MRSRGILRQQAPTLLRITRKCSCRNEYSKQETVGEDNE